MGMNTILTLIVGIVMTTMVGTQVAPSIIDQVKVKKTQTQTINNQEVVFEAIKRYTTMKQETPEDIDDLFSADYKFELGKAVTVQEGTDVTIIATGIMVAEAKVAAETLAQEGISARVLNIHTIKPIDVNAIVKAAQETGCIVTCEEHSIIGGLGSAVAEVLVENNPVPMLRLGVNDTFGESGKPNDLLKKYKLTSNDIVLKVKEVMAKKK